MTAVVIGTGRSGTNMALEILTGNDYFCPSTPEEDKQLCKRREVYPDNYLTKCDTVYMTYAELGNILSINPNMKVIWTMRHPKDLSMSKIYRGQPYSKGGDCHCVADDATIEGCLFDIQHMFDLYCNVTRDFKDRVLLVKMEDMINDVIGQAKRMCEFIGVQYSDSMPNFCDRMRNRHKVKRYKEIDKGEVCKYKDWKNIYDGFFVKEGYDIESLFKKLDKYIVYFQYE